MRRIGIDYGSKKIGVAITDDGGQMAFPHEVVPNNSEFFAYLTNLIQEREVEEVVIGHSINNSGEPNQIHEAVEALMMDITLHIGVPVHLEPEQYSTQEARQIQGSGSMTDASAAAIILNSFITKQKN